MKYGEMMTRNDLILLGKIIWKDFLTKVLPGIGGVVLSFYTIELLITLLGGNRFNWHHKEGLFFVIAILLLYICVGGLILLGIYGIGYVIRRDVGGYYRDRLNDLRCRDHGTLGTSRRLTDTVRKRPKKKEVDFEF